MKQAGIYVIQSLTHPERLYIGSAVNIEDRWRCHKKDLRKNKHHSKQMQRHCNKYGLDDLIFSAVEFCPKEILLSREQEYLDIIDPIFNSCKIAGNMLGFKFSDESIEKLRLSHLGKPNGRKGIKYSKERVEQMRKTFTGMKYPNRKPITEETKEKIRKTLTGRVPTQEARVNMRASNRSKQASKTVYTFIHDEYGSEMCTMYELTKKYNIPKGYINHLCKGAMPSILGWKLLKT